MYWKDLSAANDISLCHMYWKDLSSQFTGDILQDTSTKTISLNTLPTISLCAICTGKIYLLPTISLCAICTGKIYLVNLLEISCRTPPPKLLVLTHCHRYLYAPYLLERFICCQRYLSVPYLQESLYGQFTRDISQDTSA